MKSKEAIAAFQEAYALWKQKGSIEMMPVVPGKGPFSNKLSMASNYRLFYLYDPKYMPFSYEVQ